MTRKLCTVQSRRSRLASFAAVLTLGIGLGTGLGWTVANAQPAEAEQASPAASPARGTSAPRTVTWYADNPRARAQVELACLDDPGQFRRNRDCINAHQAAVTIAIREARARTGSLNPATTQFWASDPEARANKILMCRTSPQTAHCNVAKRSLEIEANAARR